MLTFQAWATCGDKHSTTNVWYEQIHNHGFTALRSCFRSFSGCAYKTLWHPAIAPSLSGRCGALYVSKKKNNNNNRAQYFQTFQAFHQNSTIVHCLFFGYQHLNVLQDMEQIHHPWHFSRTTDKFHKQDSLGSLPRGTTQQYPRNSPCLKNTKSSCTSQRARNSTKSWFLAGVPGCIRSLCTMGHTASAYAQRPVGRWKKFKMAAKSRSGGTQRVLQKLNKSIEDGEYYEAHQLIRTLYFRWGFFSGFDKW